MTTLHQLHEQWLHEPAYQASFDALETEFNIAKMLIETRIRVHLSQEELAQRMATTQATIQRMEEGKLLPSTRLLTRFAQATGTQLKISFEPFQYGK